MKGLESSQILAWLLEEVNLTSALDKNDLITLLELVNSPINLQSLFLVLKNLPQVLATAKTIRELDSDHLPEIDYKKALETCNTLLQHEKILEERAVLSQLFPDSSRSVWLQLHGIIESHPLYSSLCFNTNHADVYYIYRQLQAQVLLASHIIVSSGKGLSELAANFRSIRKLCETNCRKELLTLPVQIISGADYLTITKNTKSDTHINSVGIILERAYHGRQRKKNQAKGTPRGNSSPRNIPIEDLEDFENPAALLTGENFIPRGVLSEKESLDYGNFGGSSSEFTGGQDEVPVPVDDYRGYSGPTLRELAFQGKQRSNQEALKNQLNPMGWNELNQFDIHILCKFICGEIMGGKDEPEDLFLRDCLSLMFWLSAPLKRVLNLQKFKAPPNSISGEGLYLKGDKALIARLYSPGPPLESQSINITSKLAYQVEYYCNIPLPMFAHSENLVSSCRNASSLKSNPLETTEIDDEYIGSMDKQIRAELGKINTAFGTRLSIGRICHYWLHALGAETGEDPPSSMLFFGHREKTAAARLHYTCSAAQRMEGTYRRICSDLFKELGRPADFPDDMLVNEMVYLGTPLCPEPYAIKNLVKSLLQAIKQSRPTRKQFSSVKNFHFHFTLYTACLIAFATTYRAVRDPSLYEKDIHFATGLGVISDKDDVSFYHSRFVWISEICRQQIINYRRHLQRLYEVFGLRCPALFKLFKELDLQGRPLSLFLISRDNASLVELGPGIIEKYLGELHQYDLPANSNRHYMKTELMERKCPLEVIEAQLGHWEQGQEPWNRFSNLHPREFCRQLDFHLSPILKRDGWIAVKGYDS